MQQVFDRHPQVQLLLGADAGGLNLFLEHLLIERHNENIVDVEALTGMHQHAHQIAEVIGLVPLEEVVLQGEGFKDEVDVLLVGIVLLYI